MGRKNEYFKKSVFASYSEKENFYKLQRVWGEKYKIYHNLPFLNVLEHRNLLRFFKEMLKKAGLTDMRFHNLRHTAATLMLKEGTNPKIVQERLGHADITLTLNTYSHVLPSMQDEVAEKLDELVTLVDVGDQIKTKNELPSEQAEVKSSL